MFNEAKRSKLKHFEQSEKAFALFLKSAVKKKAGKGNMLFCPPKKCQKILFIESGLLRGFKVMGEKDLTHHFFYESWFATDYESFLSGRSGTLWIEALTDVTYYELQKESLLRLYHSSHELERLGRIIAEKAYLITVDKLTDMQTLDLKDRYLRLIEKKPELFRQVPQKHIASYLGVSEQSLSRVKRLVQT